MNVGTGPATNIVVAQAARTGLTRGLDRERWFNPVLIPSIPAGGKLALTWLGGTMGLECALGASYTDVQRHFYTTKCGDDVSMFFVGLHLPRWPLLKLDGQKMVKTWWGVEDLAGPSGQLSMREPHAAVGGFRGASGCAVGSEGGPIPFFPTVKVDQVRLNFSQEGLVQVAP
ncbi:MULTISPECIES: hypothetical protein [unclassified Streptomyces]|uniref:hypothetical protein n=1 Tax=unclassified Streptomyces TaxID=2593676 RepID=UPI00381DA147